MDQRVAIVRSFNRSVGQRIGALDDHFLGRGRPMGESRLLFEIAATEEIRRLRARLGLDSGYISRLLRSLERQGLVEAAPGGEDGRVRHARLTEAGRAEVAELDRRSELLAESILKPLTEKQRDRLAAAMAEVERLLRASAVAIAPARPRSPAARFCMAQYFHELDSRFDRGFDPDASISADDAELSPPAGLLLVATLHGEPIGCGALKQSDTSAADIKRMWVAPAARGLGLGRRILGELEAEAGRRGIRFLRLETNGALSEAQALYRSAGYREVAPFSDEAYADHWFEKRLPETRG